MGGWEKSTVGWSEKASTAGILETQIMSRPSDDLGEERTDSVLLRGGVRSAGSGEDCRPEEIGEVVVQCFGGRWRVSAVAGVFYV